MTRLARFLLSFVLVSVVLAGDVFAGEMRTPVLWWNDPQIVEQVKLTEAQRQKMDTAWAAYQKKIAPVREARAHQRDFIEALEKGDYEHARQLLSEWVDADQTPRRAMAELKLDILPQLTQEQRVKLLQSFPRLVRRNWSPSIVWGVSPAPSRPEQRTGPGAGPAHKPKAPPKP